MNGKTAQAYINDVKQQRKREREELEQQGPVYRIFWVNPITSLMHTLPYVDVNEGTGASAKRWLFFDRSCPVEQAHKAINDANDGKLGVCERSRFTTYLVQRLR